MSSAGGCGTLVVDGGRAPISALAPIWVAFRGTYTKSHVRRILIASNMGTLGRLLTQQARDRADETELCGGQSGVRMGESTSDGVVHLLFDSLPSPVDTGEAGGKTVDDRLVMG